MHTYSEIWHKICVFLDELRCTRLWISDLDDVCDSSRENVICVTWLTQRTFDLCDVTHPVFMWFVDATHPEIYVPWLIQRYVCDFPDRRERNDGTPTPCSENVICVWRDWSRDMYTMTYSEMFVWLSHRHGRNGGTRTPCFEDAISKNKLTCAQDCKLNPSTSVFCACCRLV